MREIVRTTLIGGVLFLIPLVFVVVVIEKAYKIMKVMAMPLKKIIPIDSIAGIALEEILTIIIMLLCCLLAGMVAHSTWGRVIHRRLDTALLNLIPGYAWMKGVTGGIRDDEAEKVLKPVLVRFDDYSQVAFEADRTVEGMVAIYLPDAPNPRSGSVSYVTADRVEPIDTSFMAVVRTYKHLGRGSADILGNHNRVK